MRPDRQEAPQRPLPLAMAAVTVAGQCRERSPADIAIFGADAARFAERFVDRTAGEAVLAEALSAGTAETRAALLTGNGEAAFQVSLWRQRGGDRIRLLAAFAQLPAAPVTSAAQPCGVSRDRIETFGGQLRMPLGAIMGFAERMRRGEGKAGQAEASELAGDILAASWRMMRLVDDLVLVAEMGIDRPPLRMGEVDIARLSRRVLRLAEPMATAAGVTLGHDLGDGAGPSVLADETTLWSVIENLVRAAVLATGREGEVRLACRAEAGDLVLSVEAMGRLRAQSEVEGPLRLTEEMSAANGAHLEVATADGFAARLTFPKERYLNPI